jgi:hypothetical protein
MELLEMTTSELDMPIVDRVKAGRATKGDLVAMLEGRDSDIADVGSLCTSEGLIALADLAASSFCENELQDCRGLLAAIVSHKLVAVERLAREARMSTAEVRKILSLEHDPVPAELRTIMTALRIIGRPKAM